MLDALLDALVDSLKVLAVLVVLNILISLAEGKATDLLFRKKKYTTMVAVGMAVIPQCGFSVLATDLYQKRKLTAGALIGVYIATSDEALPIMIANPDKAISILPLILIKVGVGIGAAFLIDRVFKEKLMSAKVVDKSQSVAKESSAAAAVAAKKDNSPLAESSLQQDEKPAETAAKASHDAVEVATHNASHDAVETAKSEDEKSQPKQIGNAEAKQPDKNGEMLQKSSAAEQAADNTKAGTSAAAIACAAKAEHITLDTDGDSEKNAKDAVTANMQSSAAEQAADNTKAGTSAATIACAAKAEHITLDTDGDSEKIAKNAVTANAQSSAAEQAADNTKAGTSAATTACAAKAEQITLDADGDSEKIAKDAVTANAQSSADLSATTKPTDTHACREEVSVEEHHEHSEESHEHVADVCKHEHDGEEIPVGCCHHHLQPGKSHDKKALLKAYLLHPVVHSLKIFAYVLAINIIFGIIIYFVGEDKFVAFLDTNKFISPIFSVLIGVVPNCAASVILSTLFVEGNLGFGACIGGLTANAGLGLVLLFKKKADLKTNLIMVAILLCIAIIVGYVTSLFDWFVFA